MIPHSIYGYALAADTPAQLVAQRPAQSGGTGGAAPTALAANVGYRGGIVVAELDSSASQSGATATQAVAADAGHEPPPTLHSIGWLAVALPVAAVCLMLGTLAGVAFGRRSNGGRTLRRSRDRL